MRISDWSSDLCSSDLLCELVARRLGEGKLEPADYYKLRLYRRGLSFEEKRKYFSNQAIPPSLLGDWAVVAQDKLLTYCVLNSLGIATPTLSSEARRVGKECVSKGRFR